MNDLAIIDVSALIYTGTMSKYFNGKRFYNLPVGGIHYLMRQVSTSLALRDSVVLCFDSPSFRAKLSEDYKSGRRKNHEVFNQIERVYDGLMSAGVGCYKFDGFEADDIIHWAVEQNAENFNDVVVIGNDIDLCHEVQSGVRFKSIVAGTGSIHVGNFSDSVSDSWTKFNTISAKKVFCGCSSDHIPAMKFSNGMSGMEVYKRFCSWLDSLEDGNLYAVTSFWKMPLVFVNTQKLCTPDEWKELCVRVQLVYPAQCPDDVKVIPACWSGVNKDNLFKFLTMCGDYDSIKCLDGKKVELTEMDKNELRELASRLNSGEYAVDRDLPVEPQTITKTLNLDSFSKEF